MNGSPLPVHTKAVVFDLSGAATDFARKLKDMREADALDFRLHRVEGHFPPPASGESGRLVLWVETDPVLDATALRERVAAFVPSPKVKTKPQPSTTQAP